MKKMFIFKNSNLKRLVLASLFIGCTIQAQGQSCENCFVTTWNTELGTGQTGNTTIMLPITKGAYDVDVNNDGDFDDPIDRINLTGTQLITLPHAGINTIAVRPNPDNNTNNQLRIRLYESGGEKKLSVIKQWGSIVWTSMKNAFRKCSNMTIAENAGVPNLTMVTNMDNMFRRATYFNGNISKWNVSEVTSMGFMFSRANDFTSDLSTWNMSNVTITKRMFSNATSFNADLSNWNVSNVVDMGYMFYATNFTGDLSSWNVSKVTNMAQMFTGATSFTSENYDALLTEWAKLTLQNDVTFTAPPTTYCAGKAGRDILTGTHNWTIEGDNGLSCPVAPFVTTWNTELGDPGNATIELPITGAYDVDTNNDGTFDLINHQSQTITLGVGTHTIAVRPNAANTNNQLRISHYDEANGPVIGTPQKLVSIDKWGGIVWTSMENAFRGCSNMTISNEAGAPDLSISYQYG